MKNQAVWSLRGVTPETRRLFQDAARRSGKTVGTLADEVLQREARRLLGEDIDEPSLRQDVENLRARLERLEEGQAVGGRKCKL